MASKLAKMVIAIVLVAIVAYAAITYTRTVASFTVSLTAGIESKTLEFDVPSLHEKAQVVIDVQSGLLVIWSVTIYSGEGIEIPNILWNDQGSGDYLSNWINLPAGHYILTFVTLGGDLEAQVKIITKGGIW